MKGMRAKMAIATDVLSCAAVLDLFTYIEKEREVGKS
jgi:hypothetical protein